MKRIVNVFNRGTRVSQSDGTAKTYLHNQELCELLGNADSHLLTFIGDRRSSSSTKLTIRVYEGADPDSRPSDVGTQLTEFSYEITALRPAPLPITGPFTGKLDITVTVEEDAAPQSTEQEFQFTLVSTGQYPK